MNNNPLGGSLTPDLMEKESVVIFSFSLPFRKISESAIGVKLSVHLQYAQKQKLYTHEQAVRQNPWYAHPSSSWLQRGGKPCTKMAAADTCLCAPQEDGC